MSSLRILNRVVLLVKEQYFEPDRINPREMLLAALGAVEETVPEVVVNDPDGDRLSVQVGEDKQLFLLDEVTSLWELSFKLRDVFRFIEAKGSPDLDRQEVVDRDVEVGIERDQHLPPG